MARRLTQISGTFLFVLSGLNFFYLSSMRCQSSSLLTGLGKTRAVGIAAYVIIHLTMSLPGEIQNEVQIKSVWFASASAKIGKWKIINDVNCVKPMFFPEKQS